MSSPTATDLLPALDSPLDAVDSLLSAGAVLGLTAYGTSLLLGDVEAATVSVGLGVACVLGALTFRSARALVGAWRDDHPGADRTST
ncbi:hypothetical protein [Haloplanus pelagicus]|uniref:hypothetical protein n=1 Tax=Haloplanus pelagicus TaxID=2949995 RepID=UPI00203E54F8|nr:hypothetical protein [Haloplanus sp. HW8-1]